MTKLNEMYADLKSKGSSAIDAIYKPTIGALGKKIDEKITGFAMDYMFRTLVGDQ